MASDCFEDSSETSSDGLSDDENVHMSPQSSKSPDILMKKMRKFRQQQIGASDKGNGQLITLNLDMGHRGVFVLHGLHNQNPNVIAEDFCAKNLFGPKTAAQVASLVEEKLRVFNDYQQHELKK